MAKTKTTMATKTKTKTAEEKALALTSEGIFREFEKAIPKGATTVHVLEAAAMLIGNSLIQMDGTKQDIHNVFMRLEEWVLNKVEVKKDDNEK